MKDYRLPGLKLLEQILLELSVAQGVGDRNTDLPANMFKAICSSFFEEKDINIHMRKPWHIVLAVKQKRQRWAKMNKKATQERKVCNIENNTNFEAWNPMCT